MTYGIQTFTDNGAVQLDSRWPSLVLADKKTVTLTGQYPTGQVTTLRPDALMFIKCDSPVAVVGKYNNDIILTAVTDVVITCYFFAASQNNSATGYGIAADKTINNNSKLLKIKQVEQRPANFHGIRNYPVNVSNYAVCVTNPMMLVPNSSGIIYSFYVEGVQTGDSLNSLLVMYNGVRDNFASAPPAQNNPAPILIADVEDY